MRATGRGDSAEGGHVRATQPCRHKGGCDTTLALAPIGRGWALFIPREWTSRACCFGDICAALPGLYANISAQWPAAWGRPGIFFGHKMPPLADAPIGALTIWPQALPGRFRLAHKWRCPDAH